LMIRSMIRSMEGPPRPANGAKVAVCSTSSEKAVKGIVATMLPEFADQIPVFAGDVVPCKKPAPDIYNLAAARLGVNPARCVVIEDTRIGLLAGGAVKLTLTRLDRTGLHWCS